MPHYFTILSLVKSGMQHESCISIGMRYSPARSIHGNTEAWHPYIAWRESRQAAELRQKNIRWIWFGFRFLRQVGHFFCAFTDCTKHVLQNTCLRQTPKALVGCWMNAYSDHL